MADRVVLHGYRFSVYTRAARLTLLEKGIAHSRAELDPFGPDRTEACLKLHPFGRVPVLCHGDFTIYETAAITRYADTAFGGPALTPVDPRAQARMAQVISVIDSYAYWPLVRQVFAHRVFRQIEGEEADPSEIEAGLTAAGPVLAALEAVAAEGLVLGSAGPATLADCHLSPMIDYFTRAPEGTAALARFPYLSGWWARARQRPAFAETDPDLPTV